MRCLMHLALYTKHPWLHDHNSNKSLSFVADKWVCISNYIVFESYVPLFLNLPCILLFKYNCVHWHFLKHFLFCCLTSCTLSGNVYYMFPSHYCLNMCSAVDNYVHERTVYTRLFFPKYTKTKYTLHKVILANTAQLYLTLYILAKIIVWSLVHGPPPAFCHLPYHTADDKELPWNETRSCASFAHKVMGFVEPPLISCSLTFCSLSGNKISNEGACELAEALQVNQSLQTLEWVQPFISYFLGSVLWPNVPEEH